MQKSQTKLIVIEGTEATWKSTFCRTLLADLPETYRLIITDRDSPPLTSADEWYAYLREQSQGDKYTLVLDREILTDIAYNSLRFLRESRAQQLSQLMRNTHLQVIWESGILRWQDLRNHFDLLPLIFSRSCRAEGYEDSRIRLTPQEDAYLIGMYQVLANRLNIPYFHICEAETDHLAALNLCKNWALNNVTRTLL